MMPDLGSSKLDSSPNNYSGSPNVSFGSLYYQPIFGSVSPARPQSTPRSQRITREHVLAMTSDNLDRGPGADRSGKMRHVAAQQGASSQKAHPIGFAQRRRAQSAPRRRGSPAVATTARGSTPPARAKPQSEAKLNLSKYSEALRLVPQAARSKAKLHPVTWLLRHAEEIYESRYTLEIREAQTELSPFVGQRDNHQAQLKSFPRFLYHFFGKKFGLKSLVLQNLTDTIFNTEAYRESTLPIELFARFVDGTYTSEQLSFFLYVRHRLLSHLNTQLKKSTSKRRINSSAGTSHLGLSAAPMASAGGARGSRAAKGQAALHPQSTKPWPITPAVCVHLSKVIFSREDLGIVFLRVLAAAEEEQTGVSSGGQLTVPVDISEFLRLALYVFIRAGSSQAPPPQNGESEMPGDIIGEAGPSRAMRTPDQQSRLRTSAVAAPQSSRTGRSAAVARKVSPKRGTPPRPAQPKSSSVRRGVYAQPSAYPTPPPRAAVGPQPEELRSAERSYIQRQQAIEEAMALAAQRDLDSQQRQQKADSVQDAVVRTVIGSEGADSPAVLHAFQNLQDLESELAAKSNEQQAGAAQETTPAANQKDLEPYMEEFNFGQLEHALKRNLSIYLDILFESAAASLDDSVVQSIREEADKQLNIKVYEVVSQLFGGEPVEEGSESGHMQTLREDMSRLATGEQNLSPLQRKRQVDRFCRQLLSTPSIREHIEPLVALLITGAGYALAHSGSAGPEDAGKQALQEPPQGDARPESAAVDEAEMPDPGEAVDPEAPAAEEVPPASP